MTPSFPDGSDAPVPASSRLLSLDIFRGFNIAAMIAVNMTWDRGLLPEQMFHIGWNSGEQGATFTDLVFPWFIFIAGVAIPFSMRSGRGRSLSTPRRILIATHRAVVIYFLGLLLDAATSGQFRFLKWNILQMIAGAYLIGTLLMMAPFWIQAVFVAGVLGFKWYVLSVMPHPDHGASVWFFAIDGAVVENRYAPGAIPLNGEQVFKSRLLATKPALPLSETINYSPFLNWLCNAFNLLPAAVVCVLGAWTGLFIRRDTERRTRTGTSLLVAGTSAWLLSWLWNLHHPWSKDFFTASYAVMAAGTGAGLLGLIYLLLDASPPLRPQIPGTVGVVGLAAAVVAVLVDAPQWAQNVAVGTAVGGLICWRLTRRSFTFRVFRVFGLNAIAIYFVNEMLFKMVFTKWSLPVLETDNTIVGTLYGWLRADRIGSTQLDTIVGSWLFAATWLFGCWLFVRWLDRRGVYIKV
ncbi:MAG: heparan-alpha-glucosaminide N-acetyltransferase domain-containing protein [Planctomycetota bacterium]